MIGDNYVVFALTCVHTHVHVHVHMVCTCTLASMVYFLCCQKLAEKCCDGP